MLRTVFLIAHYLISAYIYILLFRLLVTWFVGLRSGRIWDILRLITDPVLRIFGGIGFLRRGAIDLTPLAAILTLQVLAFFCLYFSSAPVISLLSVLAALGLAVWWALFSILIFFLLLSAVRLIGSFSSAWRSGYFFMTIGRILEPLILVIGRLVPKSVRRPERAALIGLFTLLLAFCLLGFFIVEPALRLASGHAGLSIRR